jgi:hypothetical protein
MEYIENRTFDEIQIGDSASLVRTLTSDDINLFAVMSCDVNPAHVVAGSGRTFGEAAIVRGREGEGLPEGTADLLASTARLGRVVENGVHGTPCPVVTLRPPGR